MSIFGYDIEEINENSLSLVEVLNNFSLSKRNMQFWVWGPCAGPSKAELSYACSVDFMVLDYAKVNQA